MALSSNLGSQSPGYILFTSFYYFSFFIVLRLQYTLSFH